MVEQFATICGSNALFDFGEEPLIVAEHTLDGFDHQGFARAALFGSGTLQLFPAGEDRISLRWGRLLALCGGVNDPLCRGTLYEGGRRTQVFPTSKVCGALP